MVSTGSATGAAGVDTGSSPRGGATGGALPDDAWTANCNSTQMNNSITIQLQFKCRTRRIQLNSTVIQM